MTKEEFPFCDCGCGERVSKVGNRFINHHQCRGMHHSQETKDKISEGNKNPKPKPIALLCKCGCGELANPGRDYIKGHSCRGRHPKFSDQARKNMSDAKRGKSWTESQRIAITAAMSKEKDPLPNGWEIKEGSKIATNKECGSYLGIVVAEQLLAKMFNNVQVMPIGNMGFDFICNKGMRVDSKSSATGDKGYWLFNIERNKTADYFILIAFNNRKELKIEHIWLIPGKDINNHKSAQISKVTISKWSKYEQPIDKAILCCNEMKEESV